MENDIEIKYAGFWRRLGAYWLDGMILSIVLMIIVLVVQMAVPIGNTGTFIISFVFSIGYLVWFPASKYMATPGKIISGLQIIKSGAEGGRISYGRAVGRLLVSLISFLILCLGHLVCLFNKKKRTLHDFAAGTVVVKKEGAKSYFWIGFVGFTLMNIGVGTVAMMFGLFSMLGSMTLDSDFGKPLVQQEGSMVSGSQDVADAQQAENAEDAHPLPAERLSNQAGPFSLERSFVKSVPIMSFGGGDTAKRNVTVDLMMRTQANPLYKYASAPDVKIKSVFNNKGENVYDRDNSFESNAFSKAKKAHMLSKDDSGALDLVRSIHLKGGDVLPNISQITGTITFAVPAEIKEAEFDFDEKDLNKNLPVGDRQVQFGTSSYSINDKEIKVLTVTVDAPVISAQLLDGAGSVITDKPNSTSSFGDKAQNGYSVDDLSRVKKIKVSVPVSFKQESYDFAVGSVPALQSGSGQPAKQGEMDKIKKLFEMSMQMAEKGDAKAQYYVAYAYGKGGMGVKKDIDKMMIWMHKAADQKYEKAVSALEYLEKTSGKAAAANNSQKDGHQCYWMTNSGGKWIWVPISIPNQHDCQARDSCKSGGACYKWATSAGN